MVRVKLNKTGEIVALDEIKKNGVTESFIHKPTGNLYNYGDFLFLDEIYYNSVLVTAQDKYEEEYRHDTSCPTDEMSYRWGFQDGVDWATKNPDPNKTYSFEQLKELGFAFDLNGNICPPDVYIECDQNYKDAIIKSTKEDIVNRVVDFLRIKVEDHVHVDYGLYDEIETPYVVCDYESLNDMIEDVKKIIGG